MPKTCFVISPIGEEGTEVRKKADRVYETIIKRTCQELDYEVERADEIEKPGYIHSQIISRLLAVDLVIADLTGYNPNVFYELAVRHYSGKPVIHLIEKPNKIPFDVSSNRAITYSFQIPEDGFAFRDSLKNYILSTQEEERVEQNPISDELRIQRFESSDNPRDNNGAEILATVQELRQDVRENLTEFNDAVEELQDSMKALKEVAESGNRFSPEAITEILGLAKLLNEYSVGGRFFTSEVDIELVNKIKVKLKNCLFYAEAPRIVVRATLNELNKVNVPRRPNLDADEEFPPEEDLPF